MHPIIEFPEPPLSFSLTNGYVPSYFIQHPFGIGGYLEKRTPQMYNSDHYVAEQRTIHMGIDMWAPNHTTLFTPVDAVVYGLRWNNQLRDYGPTVILEVEYNQANAYLLFGHLSKACLVTLKRGEYLTAGTPFASIGTVNENGGWAPHVHVQLSVVPPTTWDMPGVVAESELKEAKEIYPDPTPFIKI